MRTRTERIAIAGLVLLAAYCLREAVPNIADLSDVSQWHWDEESYGDECVRVTSIYHAGCMVVAYIQRYGGELYISALTVTDTRTGKARAFRFIYRRIFPDSFSGWDTMCSPAEITSKPDESGYWFDPALNFDNT